MADFNEGLKNIYRQIKKPKLNNILKIQIKIKYI